MGVTSQESDNMKLFLVLVLATVAMCHPSRKGAAPAAPANPSYNPVMDILANGELRAVAVGGAKIVDVPETSLKNKKASRTARKHKVFLYDLNQYGLSSKGPVARRPARQLFGGKKAPAEPYKLEEILADTDMKILPGDKVEISFKELGNVRTARSGPKAPVAAVARRL